LDGDVTVSVAGSGGRADGPASLLLAAAAAALVEKVAAAGCAGG
jgi:hypothetical protein